MANKGGAVILLWIKNSYEEVKRLGVYTAKAARGQLLRSAAKL